jgi:hypothetical protein
MMSSTEHLIWIEDDHRCASPLDTPIGGSAGDLADQPSGRDDSACRDMALAQLESGLIALSTTPAKGQCAAAPGQERAIAESAACQNTWAIWGCAMSLCAPDGQPPWQITVLASML